MATNWVKLASSRVRKKQRSVSYSVELPKSVLVKVAEALGWKAFGCD
jgi:hypothetical protein